MDNYKENKEVYQFTNEEIFNALKTAMDGLDNNWDDGTYKTFITPDGLHVSKKKITQLLKSKFNAVPDKIYEYGTTKRVIRVNKTWLEKLGKQYEVIDEIRILKSKSKNMVEGERHCESDTMTDRTLVERASPGFDKEIEEKVDFEEQDDLLINVNNSNTNSLPNRSQAATDKEESSEVGLIESAVTSNNITSKSVEVNSDLNINNNDLSSTTSPNSNTDKNSIKDKLIEIHKIEGQAPSESVRSVQSVRNSDNKNGLQQYHDDDIDYDSLKDIFWNEFLKIEEKEENDTFTGLRVIRHGKLKKALVDAPKNASQIMTVELLDKLINRLVKEGTLAELTEGRYYRTDNSSTAA
jgi:hypothetical protein